MPITGITGGTARYLRRQKTGDYEHHEAEISFNVNVAEGESYLDAARGAATEAVNQVNFMLGIDTPRRGRPPGSKNKTSDPTEGVVNPQQTSTTSETTQNVPQKGDYDAARDFTESQSGRTTGATIPTAATVSVETVGPEVGVDPAAMQDETLFGSTPAEVTDKDLMAAIMSRNAEAVKTLGPVSAQGIRGLIGRYVANPGVDQARDIPQAKRGAFLKELAGDLKQFVK